MQASIVKKFSNIKTWLFVPATRIDRVGKAFASGTDAVIVDLEDAVATTDKVQARKDLQVYYNSQAYQPIWVRINKAGSEEFFKDVVLCQKMPNLAGVLLAKAEQASDIENAHNMTGLPVIALIETALGLYQIDSMAKSAGLLAFSYGFLDLCNDLQVHVGTAAADVIANQIRYQLLLTSKVHQLLAPIDTVYTDFNDGKGLGQRVQLWSQMGMSGMLCIHPKQVATVKQSLQPTDADIEFARRVIEEYERSGQAVFKIAGQMVDAPVIERCRQLLS
ncbi:HpcH/HpaI aldolase/citrate lyase family protein [Psychrobacter cryohalolentis]|uniref:HpcH/HpaI aldolase n=1 Tax=Psychrobacter cryohalolentis (strain ATCC BAA-1226 / DSM 17306 / VKM B-2378 / K5) TaxID=335284 RepID=Q1QCF7_PSYCK|nr:CoA ester lyase [Psychrobacter cryohalolentis]ABE74646.1 HpcH/HpaI aldolase [Psychrobacter cryohalolentis K5]ASE27264.1 CoA ester lyase [Psychrobacter cryohalolentis]